jgi:hypothetical protein
LFGKRYEKSAPVFVRVVPSKERPEPITADLIPCAPFPASKPPSGVEEPVPPYTWESVVEAETTPLTAWRLPVTLPRYRFVTESEVEVAFVVEAFVAKSEVKVLWSEKLFCVVVENAVVKTPVEELYASG